VKPHTAFAHYISILSLVILHNFLSKPVAMSFFTPTKRTRTQSSNQDEDYGHLENWFNGEATQMQKYIHDYRRKNLIALKYVTTEWLTDQ